MDLESEIKRLLLLLLLCLGLIPQKTYIYPNKFTFTQTKTYIYRNQKQFFLNVL